MIPVNMVLSLRVYVRLRNGQDESTRTADGRARLSSFIRTMTVGSGIRPDLLTFRRIDALEALAGSSLGDLPPVGNRTPP